MSLHVAKSGIVVVLCKNYTGAKIACANAGMDIRVGFGDGTHYTDIVKGFETWRERKDGLGLSIIATMNPIVFDNLSFASAEDVRSHVLLVQNDELANMTEDQAKEVFRAYEAGVQYVSEIFRTQGIW